MSQESHSNLLTGSVTYLIPVYNPTEDLLETIRSIENTDLISEIIIIDDNSTNGLIFFKNALQFPKVSVFVNEYQRGISGALNTGLQKVKTAYIARLDSGDFDLENRIKSQLELLINTKSDLVVADMYVKVDNGPLKRHAAAYETVFGVISLFSKVPHPTWLLKKSSIKVLYNSNYIRCEDYCFIAENSFKVAVLHCPAVVYDAIGFFQVSNEILATIYKCKVFVKMSNKKFLSIAIAICYLFIRVGRIVLWRRKYLNR